MECLYPCLGITCEEVGEFQTGAGVYAGMEACTDAAVSARTACNSDVTASWYTLNPPTTAPTTMPNTMPTPKPTPMPTATPNTMNDPGERIAFPESGAVMAAFAMVFLDAYI